MGTPAGDGFCRNPGLFPVEGTGDSLIVVAVDRVEDRAGARHAGERVTFVDGGTRAGVHYWRDVVDGDVHSTGSDIAVVISGLCAHRDRCWPFDERAGRRQPCAVVVSVSVAVPDNGVGVEDSGVGDGGRVGGTVSFIDH